MNKFVGKFRIGMMHDMRNLRRRIAQEEYDRLFDVGCGTMEALTRAMKRYARICVFFTVLWVIKLSIIGVSIYALIQWIQK